MSRRLHEPGRVADDERVAHPVDLQVDRAQQPARARPPARPLRGYRIRVERKRSTTRPGSSCRLLRARSGHADRCYSRRRSTRCRNRCAFARRDCPDGIRVHPPTDGSARRSHLLSSIVPLLTRSPIEKCCAVGSGPIARRHHWIVLMIPKIGRYMATIIPPTTVPRITIMRGSIALSNDSTATSTSSS